MIHVRFIKGPSKPVTSRLNESLNSEQAAEAMSVVGGEAHHKGIKFSDHVFPENGSDEHKAEVARRKEQGMAHDDIHDPKFTKIMEFGDYPKPHMYDEIMDALKSEGFTDVDYDNNKAWRPEDERNPNKVKKIGKVLGRKFPDLQKAHTDNLGRIKDNRMPGAPDPDKLAHHNKIKDNYILRMTRHPKEVYGMSADDHPWSAAYNYGHGPDVAEQHREGGSRGTWDDRFSVSEYEDDHYHDVVSPNGDNLGEHEEDEMEQVARDHHESEFPTEEHEDHTEEDPKYHIPDHPDLSENIYDSESEAEDARNDWADTNYDFNGATRWSIYDNVTGDTHYTDYNSGPFESELEAERHAEQMFNDDEGDYYEDGGLIEGNGGDGSCLSITGGCNRHYLSSEVKKGTHALYLHHKDDKKLQQPLARIALRPYEGQDPQDGETHKIIRRSTSPSGFVTNFDMNSDREAALEHGGPFEGSDIAQVTPTMQSEAHNLTRRLFPAREGAFTYNMSSGVYHDPDGYTNHRIPAKMSANWFMSQDPTMREAVLQDVNSSHLDDKPLKDIVKHKDASADDVANVLNFRGHSVKLDKSTMKKIRSFTGRDAEKVNAAMAAHLRDFGHVKQNYAGVTNEDIEKLINSNSEQVLMGLTSKGSGDVTSVHKIRTHGISGDDMNSDGGLDKANNHLTSTIDPIQQDRRLAQRRHVSADDHGGYTSAGALNPFVKQIAEKHSQAMQNPNASDAIRGDFGFHPGFMARSPSHSEHILRHGKFKDFESATDVLKNASSKSLANFLNGDQSIKVSNTNTFYGDLPERAAASVSGIPQVARASKHLKPDADVFDKDTINHMYSHRIDLDTEQGQEDLVNLFKADTKHGQYARAAVERNAHQLYGSGIQNPGSPLHNALKDHLKNTSVENAVNMLAGPGVPDEFFHPEHMNVVADRLEAHPGNKTAESRRKAYQDYPYMDKGIASWLTANRPKAMAGYVRANPFDAIQNLMHSSSYGAPSENVHELVAREILKPDSGISGDDIKSYAKTNHDELLSQKPAILDDFMKHDYPPDHAFHEMVKNVEHPEVMKKALPGMTPYQLSDRAINNHFDPRDGREKLRDMYAGEINRRHDAGELTTADTLNISKGLHVRGARDTIRNNQDKESAEMRKMLANHGPIGTKYKDGSLVRSIQSHKDLMTADHEKNHAEGTVRPADMEHFYDKLPEAADHKYSTAIEQMTEEGRRHAEDQAKELRDYARAHENFLKNVKFAQGTGRTQIGNSNSYNDIATFGDHKKLINEGFYNNRPNPFEGHSDVDKVELTKHLHDHMIKDVPPGERKSTGLRPTEWEMATQGMRRDLARSDIHPDPKVGEWQHDLLRGATKATYGIQHIRNNIMSSPHFSDKDAEWLDSDNVKDERGHFSERQLVKAAPTSEAGWDYSLRGLGTDKHTLRHAHSSVKSQFGAGDLMSIMKGANQKNHMGMQDRHHKAIAEFAAAEHLNSNPAAAARMAIQEGTDATRNHYAKALASTDTSKLNDVQKRRRLGDMESFLTHSGIQMKSREDHSINKDHISEVAKQFHLSGGVADHSDKLNPEHARQVMDHLNDTDAQESGYGRDLMEGVMNKIASQKEIDHPTQEALIKGVQKVGREAGDRHVAKYGFGSGGKVGGEDVDLHKILGDNGHTDLQKKVMAAAPTMAHENMVKSMSNSEFDAHVDSVANHMQAEQKRGNDAEVPRAVSKNFKGRNPQSVDKLHDIISKGNPFSRNEMNIHAVQHGSGDKAVELADAHNMHADVGMNPNIQPHHAEKLLASAAKKGRTVPTFHTHDNEHIRNMVMEHDLKMADENVERGESNAHNMEMFSRLGLARYAQGMADKSQSYSPSKEHLDRIVDHHIKANESVGAFHGQHRVDDGIRQMGRHLDHDQIKKILTHEHSDKLSQQSVRLSGAHIAMNHDTAMHDPDIRKAVSSVFKSSDHPVHDDDFRKVDMSNEHTAKVMADHLVDKHCPGVKFDEDGKSRDKNGQEIQTPHDDANYGSLAVKIRNHASSNLGGTGHANLLNNLLKHPKIKESHSDIKGGIAAFAANHASDTGNPLPQHVKDTLIKHFPTNHHIENFGMASKGASPTQNFGLMQGKHMFSPSDVSRNLKHIADENHPLHQLHPDMVRSAVKVASSGFDTPSKKTQFLLKDGASTHALGHPLMPKESVKLIPPDLSNHLLHQNPHQTSEQFEHHFKNVFNDQEVFTHAPSIVGSQIASSKHFTPHHVSKVLDHIEKERLTGSDGNPMQLPSFHLKQVGNMASKSRVDSRNAQRILDLHHEDSPQAYLRDRHMDALAGNRHVPASFFRDNNALPKFSDHPAYADPDHGHHLLKSAFDQGKSIHNHLKEHPETAKRYEQHFGGGGK